MVHFGRDCSELAARTRTDVRKASEAGDDPDQCRIALAIILPGLLEMPLGR